MKNQSTFHPTESNNNPEVFLRDIPDKAKRRELVITGKTTAGPLTVFMYKHPGVYAVVIAVITVGTLGVLWTLVQM